MTNFNKLLKGAFLSTVGIVSSLFFINKYKTKPKPQSIPAFFSKPAPYILAHHGGMAVRPENTKLAFDNAVAHNIDGFDISMRITKDNQLIVFNDTDVDRTTNGSGKVSEHTLDELQNLDAGYHYTDINNFKPYEAHPDARILSLGELLDLYPNQVISITLSDNPNSSHGQLIPKLLYKIIVTHDAQERVLVSSAYKEHIDQISKLSNGFIAIGARPCEIAEGFSKFNLGLGHMFQTNAHTFHMPVAIKGVKLNSPRFIHWLNERNIVPSYYGVNNLDLMNDLLFHGAHTLITDRPDLAERFKLTYH
ncbi:glycerophosphodiester phosphodiesterase family protein [Staphylococcus succinus]|uniref:Glycerophosphodiester phosphodiesterase n=1 Tax=Staphylococcus succinus TaxID=61015 RepID=A0ABX5IIB2_9STAP|nr:glycerophosphodiester phosphodiesterase family protein [Staphylococcus succinus]PTI62443.1 glycerophosphodiester phosphodiesterase [Staphylococcus succinus]PTJ19637.1 glycerophosphodiester phosphodiesterase [Staphylococcus succinus]RIN31424.1 glycerophosphodiester phosphodiesterase [Staphylococcus succinus]